MTYRRSLTPTETPAAKVARESGSYAIRLSAQALRQAALVFMEGSRAGMDRERLARWSKENLVRTGILRPRDEADAPAVFFEPGAGVVVARPGVVPVPPGTRVLAATESSALVAVARRRVVAALGAFREGRAVDTFVSVALGRGQVKRTGVRGERGSWTVSLAEETPLSEQVLALFAADALDDRARYERDLAICGRCAWVGFGRHLLDRGCPGHGG